MDLRTYLMIKQADIVFKRKDGTIAPSTGTATLNPELFGDYDNLAANRPDIGTLLDNNRNAMDTLKQRLSTNNAPARKSVQDMFGPKGVVPMGSNPMTFGKQPIKAITGIGSMPIGLDYGK